MKRAWLVIFLLIFGAFISLAQGTLAPGFYDDTVPSISYIGTGFQGDFGCCTSYYNHTYSEYRQVEFDFESTGFTVYGEKVSSMPNIDVCVDDVCNYVSVDEYPDGYIGALFSITGLSVGTHTATFYANPLDLFYLNNWVRWDAIEIHALPEPTAAPTSTPMPTDTPMPTPTPDPIEHDYVIEGSEGGQVVRFEYSVTVGDVVVSSLLFILGLLGFTAFILWIFRHPEGRW